MGICGRLHRNEVPDEAWAEFYLRLLASGRERAAFYCLPREDAPGFIRRVRNDPCPWWMLTWKGETAGAVYLSDLLGKSACVHYAFLPLPEMRHPDGVPAAVALARFCVAFILGDTYLDGTYFVDTLIGKTPVWNKAAVKLLDRIGAAILGEIPNCCYCRDSGRDAAGVISYFTRETVSPEWAEY